MFLIVKVSFLFIFLPAKTILQQIFEETYSTCVLRNEKDKEPITVLNKLWEIRGINRHQDSVVRFSICDLSTSIQDCDIGANVCVINKRKRSYYIKNAGTSFIYTKDDTDAIIFKSMNGQACDEHENFTTIIEFGNNPGVSIEPKFKFMSDCELKIEMLHPNYQPPCTLNKMGNFIDMRQLANIDIEVVHPETDQKFSLKVCKKSAKCDKDISVCELTKDGSSAIADITSQHIVHKNGIYSIQGHTAEIKKKRRNFILNLKCNWKAGNIEKVVYLKPSSPSKTFRFSGESSLACVKLPINCIVRDNYHKNFLYDLRNLYRPEVGWDVKNVIKGRINVNMCGPLKQYDRTNDCAQQHSQVCLTDGGKINLGSIQQSIDVTPQDTVITSFTDGSVCNLTNSYSTEIEFICKSVEDGPVLHSVDQCVYRIKWYTPAACAKNVPVGEDCTVSDLTGPINMKDIHQSNDRTHTLFPNVYLRYNLCGPLHKPCDNNSQAGICLVKNNKEIVLGLTNNTITINNEVLVSRMKGDTCLGKFSEIKINYHCNHMTSTIGEVQVNTIRDLCDYEFNIQSSIACSPASSFTCRFYNGNVMYDLSSLTYHDRNYEIRRNGYLYSLNVCRSVVKTVQAQCSAYAGICMRNLTEMHAKKMYVSLGMVSSETTPIFENDDLILEYKHGKLCQEQLSDRSSRIRFKCSQRDEGPMLLNKTSCHHDFIWKTPRACGTVISHKKTRSASFCVFNHPVTKEIVNLTKINRDIHFNNKNEYFVISICRSNVTYCSGRNGTNCSFLNSHVEVQSDLNGTHLFYNLFNKSCGNSINSIDISLSCQPGTNINMTFENIANCTLYANLKTSYVCANGKESKDIQVLENKAEVKAPNKLNTQEPPQNLKAEACVINEFNNFDLANLKNIKVFSIQNNLYNFNFNLKDSACNGLICKNNERVQSASQNCPFIKNDYKDLTVRLLYNSTLQCSEGYYQSEVVLRCNSSSDVPVVSKETNCTVVVQYPLQQACSWFSVGADSAGVAVGSCVGVVIFLLALGGGIALFKKRSSYRSISSEREPFPLNYKND